MMTNTIRIAKVAMFLAGLATLATGTASAVELRFSPADQMLDVGETGQLAIMLDEAQDVRTIEVTVQYPASILESVAGQPGAAFADLPCYVWEEFTSETAGQWYGFAVSFGADCYVVGPGELFVWEFTALSVGTAYINAVAVTLYDGDGEVISGVTLPGTTVVVGDSTTPVPDSGPTGVPAIQASPNPCNPTTTIRFWLPEARRGELAVFDVEGRRVRTLLQGHVGGDWTEVRWDGRTDAGRAAPSGVYLYRLLTAHERLAGRVTLAR